MKNIKIEKPENFYKMRNYWDPWKCMLEYSELEDKHIEKITFLVSLDIIPMNEFTGILCRTVYTFMTLNRVKKECF